jgi:biotin transport system substrate-specific component
MRQGDFHLTSPIAGSEAIANGRALSACAKVIGCVMLISLGAQLRIPVPWSDVPLTLQVLAVLFTGLMLPPAGAVAATLLCLTCGVAGLPVFAAGSAGLAGPTGGYLVGFVLAAGLVSVLKGGREAGLGRLLAVSAVGSLVILALGAIWRLLLAYVWGLFGGNAGLAVTTGLMPFIAKAVVEVFLAVTLSVSIRGPRGGRARRDAS